MSEFGHHKMLVATAVYYSKLLLCGAGEQSNLVCFIKALENYELAYYSNLACSNYAMKMVVPLPIILNLKEQNAQAYKYSTLFPAEWEKY